MRLGLAGRAGGWPIRSVSPPAASIIYMQPQQHNYDLNEFETPEVGQEQRSQLLHDNRIEEKRNYLSHLKSSSKQMAHQIKTLNEELDRKMERLMEKQLKRKDKERTVAEPELERKLAEKYKELDAIRGQIKKIKAKEFSIQFAVDRVKELQAELKLQTQQTDQLSKILISLTKANTYDQSHTNVMVPTYTQQITRLKDKIKQISSQRQIQTQQLISAGRKNRTQNHSHMPSIDRSRSTPKSFLDDSGSNQLSNAVAQAKKKYEELGRRIEIMRVKRNILLQEDSHLQDRVKLLQSYKVKYEEMRKVAEGRRKYAVNREEEAERERMEKAAMQQQEIREEPIQENIYSSVNGQQPQAEQSKLPQPSPPQKLSNQNYILSFQPPKAHVNFTVQQQLPEQYGTN